MASSKFHKYPRKKHNDAKRTTIIWIPTLCSSSLSNRVVKRNLIASSWRLLSYDMQNDYTKQKRIILTMILQNRSTRLTKQSLWRTTTNRTCMNCDSLTPSLLAELLHVDWQDHTDLLRMPPHCGWRHLCRMLWHRKFRECKTVTNLLIHQTGQSSNCPHGHTDNIYCGVIQCKTNRIGHG